MGLLLIVFNAVYNSQRVTKQERRATNPAVRIGTIHMVLKNPQNPSEKTLKIAQFHTLYHKKSSHGGSTRCCYQLILSKHEEHWNKCSQWQTSRILPCLEMKFDMSLGGIVAFTFSL